MIEDAENGVSAPEAETTTFPPNPTAQWLNAAENSTTTRRTPAESIRPNLLGAVRLQICAELN